MHMAPCAIRDFLMMAGYIGIRMEHQQFLSGGNIAGQFLHRRALKRPPLTSRTPTRSHPRLATSSWSLSQSAAPCPMSASRWSQNRQISKQLQLFEALVLPHPLRLHGAATLAPSSPPFLGRLERLGRMWPGLLTGSLPHTLSVCPVSPRPTPQKNALSTGSSRTTPPP